MKCWIRLRFTVCDFMGLYSPRIYQVGGLWICIRPDDAGFGLRMLQIYANRCWFWVAYAPDLQWFWVEYAPDLQGNGDLRWFWIAYAQIYRAMEGFGWIFFGTRAEAI